MDLARKKMFPIARIMYATCGLDKGLYLERTQFLFYILNYWGCTFITASILWIRLFSWITWMSKNITWIKIVFCKSIFLFQTRLGENISELTSRWIMRLFLTNYCPFPTTVWGKKVDHSSQCILISTYLHTNSAGVSIAACHGIAIAMVLSLIYDAYFSKRFVQEQQQHYCTVPGTITSCFRHPTHPGGSAKMKLEVTIKQKTNGTQTWGVQLVFHQLTVQYQR